VLCSDIIRALLRTAQDIITRQHHPAVQIRRPLFHDNLRLGPAKICVKVFPIFPACSAFEEAHNINIW